MKKLLATSIASVLLTTTVHTVYAETDCHGPQVLTEKSCVGDGLEPKETKIYEKINEYRAQHDLPPISHSPSLTRLANRHVRDLAENIGLLTPGWSNCPYDPRNQNTWHCMWNAPQRLCTAYPSMAYEIAQANAYKITADSAIQEWQRGSYANSLILNQGNWSMPWNAIGIGVYKGYAVLWLGSELDPLSVVPTSPTVIEMPALPDLGYGQAINSNEQILPSMAIFLGGLSVGQGAFQNKATIKVSEEVNLRSTIMVDSAHVGKKADIVVFATVTVPNAVEPVFYMVDDKNHIQVWNNDRNRLIPFSKNVTLDKVQDLKLYTGRVSTPGILHVFFGYRLSDGTLVSNKQPIEFTVVK